MKKLGPADVGFVYQAVVVASRGPRARAKIVPDAKQPLNSARRWNTRCGDSRGIGGELARVREPSERVAQCELDRVDDGQYADERSPGPNILPVEPYGPIGAPPEPGASLVRRGCCVRVRLSRGNAVEPQKRPARMIAAQAPPPRRASGPGSTGVPAHSSLSSRLPGSPMARAQGASRGRGASSRSRAMVRDRPCSEARAAPSPRVWRARAMSGLRCRGSSLGRV